MLNNVTVLLELDPTKHIRIELQYISNFNIYLNVNFYLFLNYLYFSFLRYQNFQHIIHLPVIYILFVYICEINFRLKILCHFKTKMFYKSIRHYLKFIFKLSLTQSWFSCKTLNLLDLLRSVHFMGMLEKMHNFLKWCVDHCGEF